MLNKFFKQLLNVLPVVICALVLALSLRGMPGNPDITELATDKWEEQGPFELSPERGRYALTYSIIEDNSLFFSLPVARFVMPDLGYWQGKYVSLFAPAVSLLIIPGYMLGKMVGLAQVGSFAVIALFALGNFILIQILSRLLGANKSSSLLGGLVFLFATPAYAYAVTLYQHHVSTFVLLLGIYIFIKYSRRWISLFLIWFICAASIMIDNPNLFIMFPLGFAALLQFFEIKKNTAYTTFVFKSLYIFTFLGMVLPLVAFGTFNYLSYGSPFRLAGTVHSVSEIDASGRPVLPQIENEGIQDNGNQNGQSALAFFRTRNLLNGFYIHVLSPDRGIIYYTPILLFSFFGIYLLVRRNISNTQILLAITGYTILLYSMWGDPWGGWAFGSRYLIPAYAMISIFVAIAISEFGKNIFFTILFTIVMLYSIAVNTAGALTTNMLPPQIQIDQLESVTGRHERYSFDRNFEYLLNNNSKSFVYQFRANKFVTATVYYAIISSIISITGIVFVALNYHSKRGNL